MYATGEIDVENDAEFGTENEIELVGLETYMVVGVAAVAGVAGGSGGVAVDIGGIAAVDAVDAAADAADGCIHFGGS